MCQWQARRLTGRRSNWWGEGEGGLPTVGEARPRPRLANKTQALPYSLRVRRWEVPPGNRGRGRLLSEPAAPPGVQTCRSRTDPWDTPRGRPGSVGQDPTPGLVYASLDLPQDSPMRRPRVCRSPMVSVRVFNTFFPSRQRRRRAGGRPLFSPVKGRWGGGSSGSARYGLVVCRMGRGWSGVGVQLLFNIPMSP